MAAEKERISKEEDGDSDEDEREPDSQESLIGRFLEHDDIVKSLDEQLKSTRAEIKKF